MFVNLPEILLLLSASVISVMSSLDKCDKYRGCVNYAHNGERCANWLEVDKWGDDQFVTKDEAIKNGIGDHNYCRNPDGLRSGPWCYHNDDTKLKVYCPIKKCVPKPEEDPKCPENTVPQPPDTKSAPLFRGVKQRPAPPPEISLQYAMLGQTLTLKCSSKYKGAVWQSGPSLKTRKIESLVINPVTEKTAGDWICTCRARVYITRVIVCHVVWTECELVGTQWWKAGYNNCTGELVTEPVLCMEKGKIDKTQSKFYELGTKKDGVIRSRLKLDKFSSVESEKGKLRDGKHAERKTEDRLDNGAAPSFCEERYRSLCEVTQGYIIGVLLAVLMFAAVHHVRKSREWRRRLYMTRVHAVANITSRQGYVG
ncbi:hypothetical protein ACHWQZ_G004071 [Mnemiopsis leidyi]